MQTVSNQTCYDDVMGDVDRSVMWTDLLSFRKERQK